MIRLSLLALYIIGAAVYSAKDWYKSLCALILLMAVVEHPDMPKTLFGIQGLSPWNLLLAVVIATWVSGRRRERLQWDLPRHISVLLLAYLSVILVGFIRMTLDRAYLEDSITSLTSEHLVNCVKWMIPGLLLYDGCRSKSRLRLAAVCVIGVYVLLGVQVIKWMPLSAAVSGEALSERSLKILVNEIGYHRVNMSAMLAGAAWAVFAMRALGETSAQRTVILLASVMMVLAQALTAGRAGYVTFACVGLVLCLVRWRVYLLLVPLVITAVLTLAPGVTQRMLEGFSPGSRAVPTRIQKLLPAGDDNGPDAYTITAGRVIMWPYVIEKIKDAPWLGYGRQAMVRTGLTHFLGTQLNEGFAHPHNAYLEMLLDNGIVGFVLVMPFYGVLLFYSIRLFHDSRSSVFIAVGGATSAFMLALLIAGMASQSFYPREGWVGMWCLMFLTLRVWVQRDRVLTPTSRVEPLRTPVLAPRPLSAASGSAPTLATVSAAAGPRPLRNSRIDLPQAPVILESALWGESPDTALEQPALLSARPGVRVRRAV